MGGFAVMTDRPGYYSLVRFTPDVARGEGRNIAVLLVGERPEDGAVRAAPLSRVASRARQAGVLDAVLRSLAARIKSGNLIGHAGLMSIASTSSSTVSITAPRPTVISSDAKGAIDNLYRAFVGVRTSREPLRKGEILDRLVATLVRSGATVERETYLNDFAFDALVSGPQPAAIQVLSFCVGESRGVTVERETGHFLFGLERIHLEANAVIQPPNESSAGALWTSYDRVQRWLDDAGVNSIRPSGIQALADRYGGVEQLPLSYADSAAT
jgi:hypothetical protein